MARYILVYNIKDYPEGGIEVEDFEEQEKMHDRVNELAQEYEGLFFVMYAGFLTQEILYKPAEIITKYKPQHKND